jgi:hypothetical protein
MTVSFRATAHGVLPQTVESVLPLLYSYWLAVSRVSSSAMGI